MMKSEKRLNHVEISHSGTQRSPVRALGDA